MAFDGLEMVFALWHLVQVILNLDQIRGPPLLELSTKSTSVEKISPFDFQCFKLRHVPILPLLTQSCLMLSNHDKILNWGYRGGGQVFNVLAFYNYDPSSNPEFYS